MLSKNKIKFITSLKKKKFRNETNLFLAEGEKLIEEILSAGFQITLLCATPEWLQVVPQKKLTEIKEVITITQTELKKISSQKTPNQVLAVVKQPNYEMKEKDLVNHLSLVLDQVNDPGNLGTIIRIADWFGIKNLICSIDTVDMYNPKVIQSSMGSICRVKIHYRDLKALLAKFKNKEDFGIYGAFLEGKNIFQTELSTRGFIVMGSESHGISSQLIPYITEHLYIPHFSGSVHQPESLNVSVATGIICSEFRRRG